MEAAAIDTSLLIDLQRSPRNAQRKRAYSWLEAHSSTVLKIPAVVLGEFSAGFTNSDDEQLVSLRQRHEILEIGPLEAGCYGRIYREMKRLGTLIGGNDLWIAATALVADLPLVTRNVEHFGRVEGLTIEPY